MVGTLERSFFREQVRSEAEEMRGADSLSRVTLPNASYLLALVVIWSFGSANILAA
jgi:hypothetical protein